MINVFNRKLTMYKYTKRNLLWTNIQREEKLLRTASTTDALCVYMCTHAYVHIYIVLLKVNYVIRANIHGALTLC